MVKISTITNNKRVLVSISLGPWHDNCSFPSELIMTVVFGWHVEIRAFSHCILDRAYLASPTHSRSAMVVSSTNFQVAVLVTSISSIISRKSLGPWGTPAGMFLHSDVQLCANLTLCLSCLRKSVIQYSIL